MQGFERIEKILGAMPNAHEIWPEWFWPCCPACGKDCDKDATGDPFCWNKGCGSIGIKIQPVYKFEPIHDETAPEAWHGTETDPRNMHHLWRILCKVDQHGIPVVRSYIVVDTEERIAREPIIDGDFCGAAIRVLCLVLGVE